MCWFVCLLPVLPYTFNVHIRWLYAFMKGLEADLYFLFVRCNTAIRQPVRATDLRRYVVNASVSIFSLLVALCSTSHTYVHSAFFVMDYSCTTCTQMVNPLKKVILPGLNSRALCTFRQSSAQRNSLGLCDLGL